MVIFNGLKCLKGLITANLAGIKNLFKIHINLVVIFVKFL